MTQIEDGGGSGIRAKVTSDGHLESESVTVTEFEHASEESGNSYIWASDAVDEAANGTLLLVKNTSNDDLHIAKIIVSSDTATEVTIHLPTVEVTPTGTAVTGVKINTGKVGAAEADAKSSETNNVQGDVIGTVFLAANDHDDFDFEGVILAKNKSIGIDLVANVTLAAASIHGHY